MAAQVRNRRFTTPDDESDVEMASLDDEMPDFAAHAIDPMQQHAANGSATTPHLSSQPNNVSQDQGVMHDVVPQNADEDEQQPWKFSGRQVQMMAIGMFFGIVEH